jgi:hypothetical protein
MSRIAIEHLRYLSRTNESHVVNRLNTDGHKNGLWDKNIPIATRKII